MMKNKKGWGKKPPQNLRKLNWTGDSRLCLIPSALHFGSVFVNPLVSQQHSPLENMKEEEERNGLLNTHFVVFKRKKKEQFVTLVSNRNTLAASWSKKNIPPISRWRQLANLCGQKGSAELSPIWMQWAWIKPFETRAPDMKPMCAFTLSKHWIANGVFPCRPEKDWVAYQEDTGRSSAWIQAARLIYDDLYIA